MSKGAGAKYLSRHVRNCRGESVENRSCLSKIALLIVEVGELDTYLRAQFYVPDLRKGAGHIGLC